MEGCIVSMNMPLPREDLDFVYERCSNLWNELRGERIFLTGGTGFFGVWLVETLLNANRRAGLHMEVTVLTRDSKAFLHAHPHLTGVPGLRLLEGDVRRFQSPQGTFSFVIHAATETWSRPHSDGPTDLLGVILGGTERVLEFAAGHGTQRFLFTSSGAVYGQQPSSISHLLENFPGAPDQLLPSSAYAEGKRAAEALCLAYSQQFGFASTIARCFAFVGPLLPLDQHFAIGNFIRDTIGGRDIEIRGDGTPRRSYMYAADLVRWLLTMLLRAPTGEAFNVGSSRSLSILELAELVRNSLASAASVKVLANVQQGMPIQQYVPDVQKAEDQLGLTCEISLEEAICKTARWHGWKQ